jgi:hypothetical protein
VGTSLFGGISTAVRVSGNPCLEALNSDDPTFSVIENGSVDMLELFRSASIELSPRPSVAVTFFVRWNSGR